MKRILVTLVFCQFFSFLCYAQKQETTQELEVLGGISYYIGDINPTQHFQNSKMLGGIFYRYAFNNRYGLKVGVSRSSLQGDDSNSKNPLQVNRNLSFKTSITELSSQLEINYFKYKFGKNSYSIASPYLFLGLSVFRINPKTELNGEWVELSVLGTEGQGTSANPRKKYGKYHIAIPFGMGIKINLSERWAIGMEYGVRRSYTDYIDDVSGTYVDLDILEEANGEISALLSDRSLNPVWRSENMTDIQRGDAQTKDWFFFTGISLRYRLDNKHNKCRTLQSQ